MLSEGCVSSVLECNLCVFNGHVQMIVLTPCGKPREALVQEQMTKNNFL